MDVLYLDVYNCVVFSVVNVYLDHLKFCVCIYGRRYVCCSECNIVSDEPTPIYNQLVTLMY